MNVEVNRMELLAAAKNAAAVAPNLSPLDIFKCTLLETEDGKLVIAATNGEMSMEKRVPATVTEDGCAAVNANLLAEMLRKLDGETVVISKEQDGRLSVTCGSAEYLVPVQDTAQYPRTEIPFPEDTVTVTGIPALVKRAAFAVSEDESRPVMKCVRLTFNAEGLNAACTDGFRVASARGESKNPADVQLLIPAHSMERLAQIVSNQDELHVGVTGTSVVFMKEDLVFSARLMEGQFAAVEKVIETMVPRFLVLLDTEALRRVVKSVSAVASEKNRFKLSFKGNRLEVMCQSEYGSSDMKLDVTALRGTPAGDCWFNLRLLQECLGALSGTLKLGVAASGALVMQTENLTCIQMPMREPKPIELRRPQAEAPAPKQEKPAKPKAVKPKTSRTRKKSETVETPGTDENPAAEHEEASAEKEAA